MATSAASLEVAGSAKAPTALKAVVSAVVPPQLSLASIWVGPETTAAEKNAALQFQQYLLSPEMQKLAVKEGLRPVTNDVNVTEGDTLFTKWAGQGVEAVVPRTTRMASPSRDVLLALLRWFDLNVGK